MATTLVITNDFPPRIGGIESFVAQACDFLDGDVVVYTSAAPGAAGWDSTVAYPVVRTGRPLLLPTPAATRQAARLLRDTGATRVLFGAAAPLALMAGSLRAAGAKRIVALTHGHESWWATVPGARGLLRRIGDDVDALATISDAMAGRIAPALSPSARARMFRLSPPVDTRTFHPGSRPSVGDRPRCVSVGRFVPRKGFDVLLRAWRRVLDGWPAAVGPPELVLVGDGPQRPRLERMCADLDLTGNMSFTGALPMRDVAAELVRAQVFALPIRTRWAGLEPEGLGLAAVEAACCGLPVVIGDSGGAPETVLPGRSGFVVDGSDPAQIADRVRWLLAHREAAAEMGAVGRRYAAVTYGADGARRVLRSALRLG